MQQLSIYRQHNRIAARTPNRTDRNIKEMASSSRKKPTPSLFSPLSLLAATFYRREEDNRTYEALAEARKAETALRKLLEVGQEVDVKRKEVIIEEAIRTLRVLKARVGKQKELATKVKQGERKERERMEEMEREIAECSVRTGGLLRRANEVRGDIVRLRREMEVCLICTCARFLFHVCAYGELLTSMYLCFGFSIKC